MISCLRFSARRCHCLGTAACGLVGLLLLHLCWAAPLLADAQGPGSQRLVMGHWSENPPLMRKAHKHVLLREMRYSSMDMAARGSLSLEMCVTCHVIYGADIRPLSAESREHFCRACHIRHAVQVGCFGCHSSLPTTDPRIADPVVKNKTDLYQSLQRWRQQKASHEK